MKKRIMCLVIAVFLLLSLSAGLTGCSDKEGAEGENEVKEEDKYGGTYVEIGDFTSFNFFAPEEGVKSPYSLYSAPAVETLGRFTNEGKIEWFLAEDVVESAEDSSLTITLREGITFSDGSELTAEVLGWNIDAYNEYGRMSMIANCQDYEVVDKYVLKMKWDYYDSSRPETLAQWRIVSKYSYDEYGYDYMVQHPIGTGAFVLDEAVESSYVSYVKRDDYWQEGLPYLDKIIIYSMTDENTQVSSLTNGEISAVVTNVGTVQQALEAAGYENVANTNNPLLVSMQMLVCTDGNEDSPWADVNVRRAAYYALDVESIIPSVYSGAQEPVRQCAVPGMWHYLEESDMPYVYEYDIEKAKDYMEQAGYPNGFDTMLYATSTWQDMAVAIQASLKEIGINAEIQLLDLPAFQQKTRQEMWDGIAYHGGSPISLSPTDWFGRNFGKEGTRTLLKVAGAYHEEIITALEHTSKAFTDEEKKEAGKEFGVAMNEILTAFPLSVSYSKVYKQDNVADYGERQTAPYEYTPEKAYVLDK